MHVATRDGVTRLHHFPLFVLFAHRTLHQRRTAPFESTQTPRRAQSFKLPSAYRSGGTGSNQTGARADGAMAIDAVYFDGGAWLAINFPVAVIVLPEMAIRALHSLFQMNICKMNGFAKTLWIFKRDLLSGLVEPVAFAIVRIDVAINPAVPMKVRKLCGLQLFFEIRAASFFQEFLVAPESACGRGFWISQRRLLALFFGGVFLLPWIHRFA